MTIQEQSSHYFIEAFLVDRKSQNLAKGTIKYYRAKLNLFIKYCDKAPYELTPTDLRQLFLTLEQDHKAGGVCAVYRVIKTYLLWYENEVEPDNNWRNPIHKVKTPRVPLEPLDSISLEDISKLIKVSGVRDSALFMCMLDSGARAAEILNINLEDINLLSGQVLIRCGKNRKPRFVFLGSKSRKAVRSYLRQRSDNNPALWINNIGGRLAYHGLRMILKRRAKQAGVPTPPAHSFRRAFCINMLRSGCDLMTLSNLCGWSSLSVAQRYLKLSSDDVGLAHKMFSPVDNGL